jgi:hypothetical protein
MDEKQETFDRTAKAMWNYRNQLGNMIFSYMALKDKLREVESRIELNQGMDTIARDIHEFLQELED